MFNEQIKEPLGLVVDNVEESRMVVLVGAVDIHSQCETGSHLLKVFLLAGLQEDIRDGSLGQLLLVDPAPGLLHGVAGELVRSS